MGKSQKKRTKKLAKRVDRWIAERGISEGDLVLAGLGALADAVDTGKKKSFKRFSKLGRKLADRVELDTAEEVDPSEPVISYSPRGGGWYTVSIDDIAVDRVQGEQAAAARAGELFERYAVLDGNAQESTETGVTHSGGGWYDVKVRGVPVGRVRGRDALIEQYGHLVDA